MNSGMWENPFRRCREMIPRGEVIYIGTLSKSIAPAIRVSYMVLPERLLEAYEQYGSFISSTVSRIDQRILKEFLRRRLLRAASEPDAHHL